MTDTESSDFSTRFEISKIIAEEGFSQAEIAKQIGMSGAAVSGFINGTYPGDESSIKKKLDQWISLKKRKAEKTVGLVDAPGFVLTPTAEKIRSVLDFAHATNDIGVIYGAAGMGKTENFRQYMHENPNVWVATMTAAHSGVTACLEETAYTLEMRDTPARAARLFREIVKRLMGTGGLMIIDEAQHLQPVALEALRSLHDATGIGFVLAGNETVYARLTGGVKSAMFAQLFSRIGKRLKITRPLKADVSGIADAYGITGKREVNVLWEIAQKPGALRGVVKTIRLAAILAKGSQKPVDEELIRYAWNDLSGEIWDFGLKTG
jgi:DNA transposition AAA+ family ATPase